MSEHQARTGRSVGGARRRWSRAAIAGAVAAALVAGPAAPADAAGDEGRGIGRVERPERRPSPHAALTTGLHDDLAAAAGRGPAARAALPDVTVVVDSLDPSATRAEVAAVGGTVTDVAGPLLQADVPPAALGRLADAPSTRQVREPYALEEQVVSQGVAQSGAAAWQAGGTTGAGQLVAVVDLGFVGYQELLGTELPASVQTDLGRCAEHGPVGSTDHGTAVAEIVHDMAPGAQLLFVCVDTDVEFASALATLAGKGVDVVNGSIGVTLAGRGDGSDPVSAAVAALRRQDVLYVAAAGNYGQRHLHVTATGDTDPGGASDDVDLSPDDALQFSVAPGGVAVVSIKWDEWPNARTDFDAYAYSPGCLDAFGNPIIYGSAEPQLDTVPSLPPVEQFAVPNCGNAFEAFYLFVDRFQGTGTPRLDVFFDGDVGGIEHVSGSSLPEPASSPAAMTVGAHCFQDGSIRSYSGFGPTIDDRTKPDISAPDGVSTATYGPGTSCSSAFQGTSASAPHVAGAAALVRAANPQLDVAEVQQLLEDRAVDLAGAGKDILTGAGRLTLGPAGSAPAPVPQRLTAGSPLRLLDTRPQFQGAAEAAFGPSGQTLPIGPNAQLALQVAGIAGVPADATAVVLNVTVTEPTQAGWVTVHPGGPVPNASNVNFAAGQTVAAHVTATVGTDDRIRLYNARGSSHVVVDVTGWYGPTGAGNAGLVPLAVPARAFDSRSGTPGYAEAAFGQAGRTTPIGPGAEVQVQLAGLGGVPQGAGAVLVNLTATGPTSSGWFTIHPTGTARPLASSLNFRPGLTVANLAVLPLGTDGKVTVFNSHGTTDAVLDVIGYYQSGTGSGYVALDPPTRSLDSRTGNGPRLGPLGPNATYRLESGRYHGVPWRATAVLLNLTAVFPTQSGWFTTYPGTAALPLASNLNFDPGTVVPNAVVSALGTDCTVAVHNARGSTDVVADVSGYFAVPNQAPPPRGVCGPAG